MIEFGKRDLNRNKIVTPAWYVVRIDGTGEKPSKDQKSTNYNMEGTIVRNADDGTTEFTDVPLDWNFNSKAMGFAVGFFESLGVTPEAGKRYDLQQSVGSELEVFVENDVYEGRTVNRVNHKYRPLRS